MRSSEYKVMRSLGFKVMKSSSHKIKLLAAIVGASTLASCIDEYNKLPEGITDDYMLVVDGQIESSHLCVFTLGHTVGIDKACYPSMGSVSGAQMSIRGSNGTIYQGYEDHVQSGRYYVQTDELDPNATYSLHIDAPNYGSFASDPLKPLDAPDIVELTYELPRPDDVVDFLLTTTDPHGTTYLLWEYDEYWEIYTPYTTYWEYVIEEEGQTSPPKYKGQFQHIPFDRMTHHGWCRRLDNSGIITSNKDYGQGALQKFCLYQRHKDNVRFQTRYYTRVRQKSISPQEYEYRHLMKTQSSEMGGLFTPMPTELPGNIRCLDGSTRAIGYVGVRGHVAEAELYVARKDVQCTFYDFPKEVPDSLIDELGPIKLVLQGYRVKDYDPYQDKANWTYRWGVDCTDLHWGASLQKPEFWQYE